MTETFTFPADAAGGRRPRHRRRRRLARRRGRQVAANLVEANLRGHDSHGVGMVPRYVDAVLEGGLAVNAHVADSRSTAARCSRSTAASGYGQVIGHEAMELGVARAKEHGVCVVGLAHSHHLGRIGQWAEQCIDARPGLDPLRQRAVAADRRAVRRPRRAPRHQPVLRRHSAPGQASRSCSTSRPARSRRARRASPTTRASRVEPGTMIDDRGRADDRTRATPSSSRSARCCRSASTRAAGLALICELLGGALAGGATGRAGDRRPAPRPQQHVLDPRRSEPARHRRQSRRARWKASSPRRPRRRRSPASSASGRRASPSARRARGVWSKASRSTR